MALSRFLTHWLLSSPPDTPFWPLGHPHPIIDHVPLFLSFKWSGVQVLSHSPHRAEHILSCSSGTLPRKWVGCFRITVFIVYRHTCKELCRSFPQIDSNPKCFHDYINNGEGSWKKTKKLYTIRKGGHHYAKGKTKFYLCILCILFTFNTIEFL